MLLMVIDSWLVSLMLICKGLSLTCSLRCEIGMTNGWPIKSMKTQTHWK